MHNNTPVHVPATITVDSMLLYCSTQVYSRIIQSRWNIFYTALTARVHIVLKIQIKQFDLLIYVKRIHQIALIKKRKTLNEHCLDYTLY